MRRRGSRSSLLDGPGAALELAKRSQFAAEGLRLCIGVNHGPVMSAVDAHRGPGLFGDGLAAGVSLSNASKPGRFVASRSFREALKASDPRRVRELGPAGTYTDAQLREHELFALDWRPAFARRLAADRLRRPDGRCHHRGGIRAAARPPGSTNPRRRAARASSCFRSRPAETCSSTACGRARALRSPRSSRPRPPHDRGAQQARARRSGSSSAWDREKA